MASVCPTCGSQISPLTLAVCLQSNVATRLGLTVKLSPHRAVMLAALIDRHPRAAAVTHIAARLWGAEDGPENERNTIAVQMAHLRRSLAPLGVQIPLRYKTGYRLVLDELPAVREVA